VDTPVSYRAATEILFLSWLVNCLVPAKLGDVYRAYLLKLNSPVSLSRTFGTVFIERILDLFAISVLGLAAGFWSFRNGLPTQIQVVFGIAVGVVIVLAALLLTLRNFGRQILVRLPVPHRMVEFYDRFEEGVFGAVGLRHLPPLVVLTGLIWATEAMRLYLVVAVQRLAGALQPLPTLCRSSLLLRLPNRQEHSAAGGVAWLFDDALPPGGGSWQGARIQLLRPDPATASMAPAAATPGIAVDPNHTLVVVSAAPARSAATLRSMLGGRGTVVDIAGAAARGDGRLDVSESGGGTAFVGDADSWQAQWGLLGALRARANVVFDGCSLSDYRMISRRRDLPPPLAPGRNRVWVLTPGGEVHRASLAPFPPDSFPPGADRE
jgi:hypothetical protein